MKTSQKKKNLLDFGLSESVLSKMSENQINTFYQRLVEIKKENKEAVTKTSTTTTYDLGNSSDVAAANKTLGGSVNVDPIKKKLVVTKEGEMDEQAGETRKKLSEKFSSKSQQKYFYSKCGDGKTKEQKKWCKMADEFAKKTDFKKLPEKKSETKEGLDNLNKKIASTYASVMKEKINSIKEGSRFTESDFEKVIMKKIEKHIMPSITKGELINMIQEQKPQVAPPKPTIAPTKPKVHPKPDNPYLPKPGINPSPKAGREEAPVITPPKTKPRIAPSKPKVDPTPDNPYLPKPGISPAPKARKKLLPVWLKFDSIGFDLK